MDYLTWYYDVINAKTLNWNRWGWLDKPRFVIIYTNTLDLVCYNIVVYISISLDS